MRSQVGRAVAAVVVLGAVLTGCGSGPSQVGSAVILGDEAIPLSQIQDEITFALGPDRAQALAARSQGYGSDYGPEMVSREIVTGAIMSDLIDRRAAAEGITIDDATLDAAIVANGGDELFQSSLYPPEVQRERLRGDLAAAELGSRVVDGLEVTVSIISFPGEAEARSAADILATGGPQAEALIAATPLENRNQTVRAADNAALATSFAFGTPSGSAIVLNPQEEGSSWTVVFIDELRTGLPPEGPSAVGRFGQQDLQLIGYRQLQPDAEALGIRVNPRYGVWDPVALGVVDADDRAGDVVLPATDAD